MGKKLLFVIAAIGIIAYATSTKASAQGTDEEEWKPDYGPNEGKAIKTATGAKLYKIVRRLKVEYVNQQAWINDGSPQIITLSDEDFNKIGEISNAKITEAGYRQQ